MWPERLEAWVGEHGVGRRPVAAQAARGLDPHATPLFRALPARRRHDVEAACRALLERGAPAPAQDFRHAPQIHISFSPWAMLRSGYRTLRYRLAG